MEAETLIHELPELQDGAITVIVGMVGTVKRITTKRSGENMAFVVLEGLEGSVEMPCFPGIYNENRDLLVEDRLVKVKGRVDHKDENETKFIPISIELFAPVTGQEPVCLLLDGQKVPRSILDDLKTILGHFPGPCPVEVHVVTPRERQCLRFGADFRVDPQTSLFAELKVLLGEAAVSRGVTV
jgi:DNA polymerase-3 subunit alpha